MTRLDQDLYRQAYEQYRQWNEAELAKRVRNAGKLTPEQAWRQYLALANFAYETCPQASEWQRKQKLASLNNYYTAVRRLEAWRRARGEPQDSHPDRG